LLIGRLIGNFVEAHNLGIVLGADGMARLAPGLVRIPDVSYFRWERFPGRTVPSTAFAEFAPDLAVEVLSPSNTAKEMTDKLSDYFRTGVRLVWYVDPRQRVVEVFTAVDRSIVLNESETLAGGDVLPGFSVQVSRLFAELDRKA
jgi:Uma2 family endonuclease